MRPEGFTDDQWELRKKFIGAFLHKYPYMDAIIAKRCEEAFKAGLEFREDEPISCSLCMRKGHWANTCLER